MRGFALQKNTAFEWAGVAYRIQSLAPDGQVLLEASANGSLSLHTKDQLLDAYRQGALTFLQDTPKQPGQAVTFSRALNELPEKLRAEVARRHRYLRAVYEVGHPRFTNQHLAPIITRVAAELGDPQPPSVATMGRWHVRFIQSQDTRSLIPRFDRRGSTKRQSSDEFMRLLEAVVEEAYRASPLATVPDIYARLSVRVEAENRTRLDPDKIRMSSLRTVHRLVADIAAVSKVTLREGKHAAERRFRLTKMNTKTQRLLERVEVDC